jgi:hypothetical protein
VNNLLVEILGLLADFVDEFCGPGAAASVGFDG